MLLKDLPYGKWFGVEDGIYGEYVFLKTNTEVAISDDSRDLFNLKYGVVALRRYYGMRCSFLFEFGLNTEVEEVKVHFYGILNSPEKYIKVRDLEKEVEESSLLSVELPNQPKNKLLFCIYKQDDRMVIVDYESGLVIDNHYLQCMLEEDELTISLIATIEDYTIE